MREKERRTEEGGEKSCERELEDTLAEMEVRNLKSVIRVAAHCYSDPCPAVPARKEEEAQHHWGLRRAAVDVEGRARGEG